MVTSVNIPELITTINYGTFYHCTGLTSIAIPNTVTLIDADAFKECLGLETVIIGSKVAEMRTGAFLNCTSLKSITSYAVEPPITGEATLLYINPGIPVYVPCGSKAAYQEADDWKNFTNYHTLTADTVAFTQYVCAGSTYSDDNFTESVPGEYQKIITGSAGCDSVITLTLANHATPTARFPEIVDPCDGGDILVILNGAPPFDVYYTVRVSGKFPVFPAKLGLGTRFGDGGYPLTKIGDNTYTTVIPSGSAKILTFKVHRVVDNNGCEKRNNND
jgi:hypothetical protein